MTPDEQHAYGVVGIPSQPDTDWALLVVDDLTEQERRELAEREFVSNAAHELRTPLTTIIGAVEVLQAGAKEDPAERDRFLGHIERESGRLARLARAMLTLARAHSGQEQPRVEAVELAPLLREVAAGSSRTTASRSTWRSRRPRGRGEPRPARAGAAQPRRERRQAHGPRLGRPPRLPRREHGHGRGRGLRARGSAPRCSATSSTASTAASATRDGFGLGLAIVRESVRTLGARIELDSSPGEGTVFRILLAPARVREEVPAA